MSHHCWKLTNISSYRWPDTTDVDFNPVTRRFEAVVTNRNGGALEDEKDEKREQTVNLWSLSKKDMYAGRADQWRFEGTLLRLTSGMLSIGPAVDDEHKQARSPQEGSKYMRGLSAWPGYAFVQLTQASFDEVVVERTFHAVRQARTTRVTTLGPNFAYPRDIRRYPSRYLEGNENKALTGSA